MLCLVAPSRRRLRAAIRFVGRSGRLTCIAHQRYCSLRGFWVPSLLAINGDAVLQRFFSLIVALEMDLIGCMVRVVDDFEICELTRSLRRNLGCLTCGCVTT